MKMNSDVIVETQPLSLRPKTKKSHRLGRLEKQVLLTLLGNGNKPLTTLQIYSFSLNINSVLPIPLGCYLAQNYPRAQWYQALERLVKKGLLKISDQKGGWNARAMLLTEKGRDVALEIYNVLMFETKQWLPYLLTIKKQLERG